MRLISKILCYPFLVTMLFSCKKEDLGLTDEVVSPTTGTPVEFTLDSIFLYAKQVYLWRETLPSYTEFDPRNRYEAVSPELRAYKSELYDISQMNVNPQTGNSYELPVYAGSPKYSYLEQGTPNNGISTMATIANTGSEFMPLYKVVETDNKKIGYLSLASFPALTAIKEQLNAIFASFAKIGITGLIIDLRSNGGGYVETAEYLANLIVPSNLTGKVMYSEKFNDLMQNGKATILKNQLYRDANGNAVRYKGRLATMADVNYSKSFNTILFQKAGNLETINNVYFIISGNTASASELLISSLKPYFDVKLIGQKTYGKPVGFFGVHIGSYTIYLSSFILQNAVGWYDYFEGMQPDVTITFSTDTSLGNLDEPGLYTALSLIGGSFNSSSFSNRKSFTSSGHEDMNKENSSTIQTSISGNYIPIYKQQFKLK